MTEIIITLEVEGFHRWPEAPDEVDFLRARHRHLFKIKLAKCVKHTDRDIEIILFKREVLKTLASKYGTPMELGRMSCEQLATELVERLGCTQVEVLEDGENGARVTT